MRDPANTIIFAGPTLLGVPEPQLSVLRRMQILPPVKRGSVEAIVGSSDPGTMIIVDGQFHQCLSVGHVEIRVALKTGWEVWGLSSMGAIRAYEMRDLGM